MKRPEVPTPDLLDTLERIRQEAEETRRRFAAGAVLNGRTALQRIEHEAKDALDRARAETPA